MWKLPLTTTLTSQEAVVLSDVEPEFKIEAGNLTSFNPSSPTTTTDKPTTTTTTTSTTTVAKEEGPAAKQPLQMGSLEDNETQVGGRSLLVGCCTCV